MAALTTWALGMLWFSKTAGVRHDYRYYLRQWQLVLNGKNPWSTDNAYGPLHNVLAYLLRFDQLAPKLVMSLSLAFAVTLIGRELLRKRVSPSSLFLYILVLPAHCVVISVGFAYGLNDALTAALISFALIARVRGHDATAGIMLGLAVLLKYYPAVLVPFFALENGRLRWRVLVVAAASVMLGLAASALVWGDSFLGAFKYGAVREPKLLSVLASLQSLPTPISGSALLGWLIRVNSVHVALVVVLTVALSMRLRLHFIEASVLGLLATLLTFKVGHPQFYLPWLCLVAALPLVAEASALRLLWTALPYVLFLDIFQYGYAWGANGYYHKLSVVRRLVGFASFALGTATIALHLVSAYKRSVASEPLRSGAPRVRPGTQSDELENH
jgi:hypothetical protein